MQSIILFRQEFTCKFTCYSIECRDTQVFNLGDVIKLVATARIYEISVTTILRNF